MFNLENFKTVQDDDQKDSLIITPSKASINSFLEDTLTKDKPDEIHQIHHHQ